MGHAGSNLRGSLRSSSESRELEFPIARGIRRRSGSLVYSGNADVHIAYSALKHVEDEQDEGEEDCDDDSDGGEEETEASREADHRKIEVVQRELALNPSKCGDGSDIVQFSAPIYYVEENDHKIRLDVIRMGSLHGSVLVSYHTMNDSAIAGERYLERCGRLHFEPGVCCMGIDIPIVENDRWTTTVEFKVCLDQPTHCKLGNYLHTARVKVIDDNVFPSDVFREQVQQEEEVEQIDGFWLFLEYCKLNYGLSGIAWRTWLTLLLDQMKNVYLVLKLKLSIYMVNDVFNDDNTSKACANLLSDPCSKVCVISAGYILPMCALHAWEYAKLRLDIHGKSRLFLRTNVFRKYLNLSAASRREVVPTEVQEVVLEDCDEAAEGYVAALEIVQRLVKLLLLSYFALEEDASALWFVISMPSLMVIWGFCQSRTLLQAVEQEGSKVHEISQWVQEACTNYGLIADYFQRPRINDLFVEKCKENRQVELGAIVVRTNIDRFTSWLGPLFIGLYLMIQAPTVFDGNLQLGTFLATLSVIKEMSSDFEDGYKKLMRVAQVIVPLRSLTLFLNMETDVLTWKRVNRVRWEQTKEHLREAEELHKADNNGSNKVQYRIDEIPIEVQNVALDSLVGERIFGGLSASVEQGKFVVIQGEPGCGKTALLELLAHRSFPSEGHIFLPTHLRILKVSREPVMMNLTLWENLTFGLQQPIKFMDVARVFRVVRRLEMEHTLRLLRKAMNTEQMNPENEDGADGLCSSSCFRDDEDDEEEEAEENDEELEEEVDRQAPCNEDDDKSELHHRYWHAQMHHTELAKIHLARAFIVNPEVMILHKPLLHFSPEPRRKVANIIGEQVKNRGICVPESSRARRRPRTVFMSTESLYMLEELGIVDYKWKVTRDGIIISPGQDEQFQDRSLACMGLR